MVDLAGAAWGVLVFASVALMPGFLVGYAANLSGFRERSLREQLVWGVALSLGVGTLLVVAVTWLFSLAVAAVLAGFGLAYGLLWMLGRREKMASRKELAVIAAFACMVLLSLVDAGVGLRLWMSVTTYDQGLRVAFVDAVMRTGVPPVDPVYWPGHGAQLRYYYFWYVDCAVVAKLADISARQALIASCVWPFVGLWAMLALMGKHLLGWSGAVLRRNLWIALALLSVTGLDVLVTIALHFIGEPVLPDMEWWSQAQVTSWLDTFLWVPHHAAALVCCLLCLLLAWQGSRAATVSERVKLGALLGLTFAGMFGLSIYVAIAAALVLAAWLVWRMFSAERIAALTTLLVASLTAALAAAPFLLQLLRSAPANSGPTAHALGFGVREILDPAGLLAAPGLRALAVHHLFAARQIAAAVLLVPGYAVELGFFAVVAVFMLRKRAATDAERTLRFWFWAGLAAASFLRSTVVSNNDYGMRSVLLPQALLLLLAVPVMLEASGWRKKLLAATALVGVAGTAYQLVLLRVYLPFQQTQGNAALAELGERSYALREAYAAMQSVAPRRALLQYDTHAGGYFSYIHQLDADRQIVNAESPCNVSFGGDPAACAGMEAEIARLFPANAAQRALSGDDAKAACAKLGATVLVATRWDAVWQARESWVWTLAPLVVRPNVRIVDCTRSPGLSDE